MPYREGRVNQRFSTAQRLDMLRCYCFPGTYDVHFHMLVLLCLRKIILGIYVIFYVFLYDVTMFCS